ncbi:MULTISPECIES: flagellar type III secretion system protein FlhB [unclassified Sphingomonas]|uniref:flagellar type III secretion system protein FlhB n=1 Tax=unclassified Sphingomonas TaxID=196159 RepID=UPI002269FF34|nr:MULTISPECIES: flagellar type III secretion system protein FlhB [unclassified Sphingomonas]
MSDEGGEKTEAPTQKRKQKAADDGNVLRSKDFATALVVLAGVAWFMLFGPSLVSACKALMAASFQFDRGDVEDFSPWRAMSEAGYKLVPSLVSLLAISLIATIVSSAGLGSLRFNGSLLAPKASRINPASGLKRIIGAHGWIELGKSLLKVVLLGVIGGYMLWKSSRTTLGLSSSNLGDAVGALGDTFMSVMIAMSLGLVAIALFDVPVQILQLFRKLRMSKQEIRDEHKESEGSPEAKGQQRAAMRAMATRGFRKAVTEAHVVLTNPTHFAVALRYERGIDQVPVVVAKGRGATALAIRDLAGEHRVPILEYPMLARAIYYTSKENQEVRDDLYTAIATVLAFVFNLNAQAGGSPPPIDVPQGARFDENGVEIR